MLQQADAGILFCPPERVVQEFPQFPVTRNYDEFRIAFTNAKRDLESSN
jgi:phosphoserine/homoserine phosphotransferase